MLYRITQRGLIAYGHDIVMAALSFWLSFYLRVGDTWRIYDSDMLISASILLALISATIFWFSGLYRGVWRYASVTDLWAITKAVTLVILIVAFAMFLWTRLEALPRSVLVINWFILMALLGGPRFLYRLAKDRRFDLSSGAVSQKQIPVLLVGAGDEAELFIRALRQSGDMDYRIVGIIAENERRVGREIHGVGVIGTTGNLTEIVKAQGPNSRPQRLILTKDNLEGSVIRALLDEAESLGMTLARVPHVTEFKAGVSDSIEVRPVAIEDLLGRAQTPLDRDAMRKLVEGRRVLITGAGGSIGSELVRQVSDFGPASLTLVDLSEFALYTIDMEVASSWPDLTRDAVLADVRDRDRISRVIQVDAPDLVFHAAALKHVPLVEANVFEGITTNTFGTVNVADACAENNVSAMVMVSTDKAINPSSIMGASKRLAEIYCQALDLDQQVASETRYVAVRFGNVLGSTGSVVPLFQRQLAEGGPLTVTHPDMTRYFMTIREAVELILQASVLEGADRSGKIFVLDMGEPVKIIDLANQMIRLAGLIPGQDIEISVTGARPGEKLFEELLHGGEELVETEAEGILLASPRIVDRSALSSAMDDLKIACKNEDLNGIMTVINTFVPEFRAVGLAKMNDHTQHSVTNSK
jgi:FlaA1/EpsC-like NDP-sugar epimerase